MNGPKCRNCTTAGITKKGSWIPSHIDGKAFCSICQQPTDFRILLALKHGGNDHIEVKRKPNGATSLICKIHNKPIFNKWDDAIDRAFSLGLNLYNDLVCDYIHMTTDKDRHTVIRH